MKRPSPLAALVILSVLLGACSGCGGEEPLFELLPPEQTGIHFRNDLPDEPELNILNYLYYYNGGGVAVGDVDGNGFQDLYFTSNLGSNRLYLNRGDYRFDDVTDRAGVTGIDGWTSGATMADVNGDGHVDIYVSGVSYRSSQGGNVLYLNRGDGTFEDRTNEFGLAHTGYSTQALFLDYDADGDLDMYLLNHSTHDEREAAGGPVRGAPHPAAGDRLFRNDGNRFVDVSRESGIYSDAEGYGLGVVASDLDLDGCIDIYVANDFQGDDRLYLNDCEGGFVESIRSASGHTSRFSMGVDAADFDNDLRPDVFVADMLPEREEILKTSANAEPFNIFELRMRAGYHPQYARNTLQLNRGAGRFSEVGYLAGVHATDWSWAALFADLDNDGLKDLFVTNGIYRRPNDLDYIQFVGTAAMQASLAGGVTAENLAIHERMPQVAIANYAFRNRGDLTFSNEAERWGLAQPGFSNGAAYADLDNDGALDLVVNDINAPARIYRNRARRLGGGHYLKLELEGTAGNTQGVGTKVIVHHGERAQMLEQIPTRGFQSSMDPRPHFGLGDAGVVDSLLVIWPDRRYQRLTSLAVDRTVTLRASDATQRLPRLTGGAAGEDALLEDVTDRVAAAYRHRENEFFDFNREPLIPHQLSREGPALAVADVNGDGLDDMYLGGAKWQAGELLIQGSDGGFRRSSEGTFQADSLAEDVDAVFFDANGDGSPDLYVVSGGNEFWGNVDALRDRLYLNDGDGGFTRAHTALPDFFANGSTVAAADFDRDGDVDLFVGSRAVAREYGRVPKSHLLRNDGTGRFSDVTAEVAPMLSEAGMVTAATWLGGQDGVSTELVIVGEWMPVRLFRLENGRLVEKTDAAGFAGTEGWWNSVTAADLDGDGRDDLVLGNLGLNSFVRASAEEPARLYVHDFARTGTAQPILTVYRNGVSYPLAGRDELVAAIPTLASRYPTYADFGASRIEDIFSREELAAATVLEARQFASMIGMRRSDGTFELRPLPPKAQLSPIYAAQAADFDADGAVDLLVAGNFHGVTPLRGRYDASYGELLRGAGDGTFTAIDMERSGVQVKGEVRGLALLRAGGEERLLVVAMNDDSLRVLRMRDSSQRLTAGLLEESRHP